MASGKLIKNNFNAGEWTPMLAGRTDLDKYFKSCSDIDNMVPISHGPAMTRPGLEYIGTTKDSTKTTRLIPFVATDDSAYMLEFGDLHFRVYTASGRVGTVEVVTPYAHTDLAKLKFAQSADVMYLTHEDFAPRKIIRIDNTTWALAAVDLNPPPSFETNGYLGSELNASATLTPASASGDWVLFTVGSGVMQGGDGGRRITFELSELGATYAGITVDIVGNKTSTEFYGKINGTLPSTTLIAANAWRLTGTPSGSVTPSLSGPTGTNISLRLSTGTDILTDLLETGSNWWTVSPSSAQVYYLDTSSGAIPSAAPNSVLVNGAKLSKWVLAALPPTAAYWNWGDFDSLGYSTIYINTNGVDPDSWAAPNGDDYVQYGSGDKDSFRLQDVGKFAYLSGGAIEITEFVGPQSVQGVILKTMTTTDETALWTLEDAAFDLSDGTSNDNPRAVDFYEDRLWFGGTRGKPQTFWGSETGLYESFVHGTDDGDSVSFTLLSRKLTKILWMEGKDSLFIGTTGGVWRADGGSTNVAISPSNVSVKQATNVASSISQPVSIGSAILYVQAQGQKIYEVDQSTDLLGQRALEASIMGEHLLINGVTQLCHQQDPYGVLWMTRGDGALIGMTYLKEQEVTAMHYHFTAPDSSATGTIESTAVVEGSSYDELWCITNRTINGSTVRYIEKMGQFFERTGDTDLTNAVYSDSAITISSPGSTTLTGLGHLEGETVSILGDGKPHKQLTVASGQVTMDWEPTTAQVGLPYNYWVQTHKLEAQGPPATSQGSDQRVVECQVRFNNTVAAKAGPDIDNLDDISFRTPTTGLDTAIPLFTGDKDITVDDSFEKETKAMVYGSSPLPMTVVAVMPTIEIE